MNSRTSGGEAPLVSIITPSFNQSRFIEETMLSVKNQDYPSVEHIIVDGNSTDNTIDVLKKYENMYEMHWISEKDEGQTDAINKGFRMAKGEIIGWLNSDDLYFDTRTLSFVVDLFARESGFHVLYGDSLLINEDNLALRMESMPPYSYQRLLRGCYLIQPSVFFRREVIERHELDINLNFVMDYEYWLRIAKEYPFYQVDRILSVDRYHPARKIIAQMDLMRKESSKVMEAYGQNFGASYSFFRLMDKISSGCLRVKGLKRLFQLRSRKNLTFEVQTDSFFASAYRQLMVKNKNLSKQK
ncbi:glycosyltransferase family 2 protein [Acidobacteriota bacterium]